MMGLPQPWTARLFRDIALNAFGMPTCRNCGSTVVAQSARTFRQVCFNPECFYDD